MLDPVKDRRIWLEELAAPEGFTIERITATTYTLDLDTLVGLCFPLTDLPWREDDGGQADPLAALVAVRRAVVSGNGAPAIIVACQADGIHLPHDVPALAPWLERLVLPVLPPSEAGVFHPKLYLARYRAVDGGETRYRLLVTSRNCTADNRWDVGLRLEGRRDGRRSRPSAALGDLIRSLADLAIPGSRDEVHMKRLRTVLRAEAAEAEGLVFKTEGGEACEFSVHGLKNSTGAGFFASLKGQEPSHLLCVSPFVDAGFLRALSDRWPDARVDFVGSELGLNAIADHAGAHLRVLRGGGTAPEAEADGDTVESSEEERPDVLGAGEGLHAKLFVARHGREASLCCGSANATTAAWGKELDGHGANVELTVQIPVPKPTIDHLLDDMREMLVDHRPDPASLDDARGKQRHDRAFQEAFRWLANSGMSAVWNERSETWVGTLALPPTWTPPEGFSVAARPVFAASDEDWRPLDRDRAHGEWVARDAGEITRWWAIRLREAGSACDAKTRERLFLLPASNIPEAKREADRLRHVVRDPVALLRLLHLAVGGGSFGGAASRMVGNGSDGARAFQLGHKLCLEDLLRACAEADPYRMAEVDGLMTALAEAEEDDAIKEFRRMWAVIRRAGRSKRGC